MGKREAGAMASFKNYYQILGVDNFADADSVKAAFRKLARLHHPDLNGNNRQAEEKFKEINEAYEVLGNPDKRAMHDTSLQAVHGVKKPQAKAQTSNKKPEHTPPNGRNGNKSSQAEKNDKQSKNTATPINELFENFLKKGFGDSAKKSDPNEPIFKTKSTEPVEKARRGEDVIVKTTITPQEATDGVVKSVNVQHNEICRRCSGTGKVNGSVCTACNGEKVSVRLKKIDVRIPAGVKTGSRVRVAKEGGRGAGGAENGDLFLQIEILIDSSLRIEGLDVHGEIAISLTDAVLGADIEVITLHGSLRMNIPPGTQTGKVFRLKEQGVHNNLTKGDHYVSVLIVTPENLSAREKELYQELAKLRPDKPSATKKPQ